MKYPAIGCASPAPMDGLLSPKAVTHTGNGINSESEINDNIKSGRKKYEKPELEYYQFKVTTIMEGSEPGGGDGFGNNEGEIG